MADAEEAFDVPAELSEDDDDAEAFAVPLPEQLPRAVGHGGRPRLQPRAGELGVWLIVRETVYPSSSSRGTAPLSEPR